MYSVQSQWSGCVLSNATTTSNGWLKSPDGIIPVTEKGVTIYYNITRMVKLLAFLTLIVIFTVKATRAQSATIETATAEQAKAQRKYSSQQTKKPYLSPILMPMDKHWAV